MARLRSIENLNRNEDLVPIQRSVAALHTRCANVRQLIGATFYLFGLVFVLGLRSAPSISVLSTIPVGTRILQNFVLHLRLPPMYIPFSYSCILSSGLCVAD